MWRNRATRPALCSRLVHIATVDAMELDRVLLFIHHPSAQFQNQAKEPRQPIRALRTGSSLSSEICSLLHDVFCRETLPLCFASRLNKAGGRKSAEQANSEPVSGDERIPVIAAIKGGVNLRGGAASASLFKL